MSSSTESAPGAAEGQLTAAIPTAPTTAEAAADFGAAVQAPALAPGLASAAFGIRDTRGVVLLSLPPEGEWELLSAVVDAAQEYAKLAGYAVNQGLGGEKRHTKGGQ
jgi:hypothetical protein